MNPSEWKDGFSMTTLYEGAFAKLNLTLDVLGKRDDEDNIQNVFFLPRNKFWFVAIALLAMATLVLSFDYRKSIWG